MTRTIRPAGILTMAAAALGGMLFAGPRVDAQQNQTNLQGIWRNSGSTIRIAVNKGELEGRFVEVGQTAAALGFKAGELSLKATQRGDLLFGEQVIRYGTGQQCYKDGRKVPVIGRLRPDGQVLAFHNYDIQITPDCRDNGNYMIFETLWERVAR